MVAVPFRPWAKIELIDSASSAALIACGSGGVDYPNNREIIEPILHKNAFEPSIIR